jgi:Mrp family chromosome partitioning ATPase/capsular polysaccharide biosynthesis protein
MISKLTFIFNRRWPVLVLVPLVAAIAVIILTPTPEPEPTRYSATVYVAAEPTKVSGSQLQQAAVDIRQGRVAEVAASIAGIDDEEPTELAKKVRPRVRSESYTIEITATSTDPDEAEVLSRAFADGYVTVVEDRLTGEFEEQLEEVIARRDAAQLELAIFSEENRALLTQVPIDPTAEVQRRVLQERVSNAEDRINKQLQNEVDAPFRVVGAVAASEVPPAKLQLPESPVVRGVITLLVALTGAIVLVAILERVNPRIDSPQEAEQIVGAPALGMIPIMRGKRRSMIERADLDVFTGPFAESFRAIRSHLDFRADADELGRPPCVMIVSSLPNEGKTTTAAFLSVSYAEVSQEVVAIGADFRRPALHRLFGTPRNPGLSTRLLANEAPMRTEDVVRRIVHRDPRTGVRVIPSGPGTDRVAGLIGDLAAVTKAGIDSGCTVVLDTAPVLVANDAVDFLPMVDYVILVVRLGSTTERSLRQTVASLSLSEAKIAGCAIVGSLESSDAKRYYYSYYRVDTDLEKEAAKAAAEAEAPTPDGETKVSTMAGPSGDQA